MPEESLLDYIKRKRKENDRYFATMREKESDLNKARGTTKKMHRYCRKHGLADIADLDRIWRNK